MCRPVSISGCHCGGCGTPYSASISGKTARERSARAQHLEVFPRPVFAERASGLRPDSLGNERGHLARIDDPPHQVQRLGRDPETERRQPRGEARDSQDAQRVLDERLRDMTQPARLDVASPAVRIDEDAVLGARHRIDGEVAPREIVLERHIR